MTEALEIMLDAETVAGESSFPPCLTILDPNGVSESLILSL